MKRGAIRDGIIYPSGYFSVSSADCHILAQPVVINILDALGDIADWFETAQSANYTTVKWNRIPSLSKTIHKPSKPTDISRFAVTNANRVTQAYVNALKRFNDEYFGLGNQYDIDPRKS